MAFESCLWLMLPNLHHAALAGLLETAYIVIISGILLPFILLKCL
jgi:hypothetical protein